MSCITKINSILIDIAKDLDIIIAMYNLLEYSDNYSMTSGSLQVYKEKIDDVDDERKSFKYKTKIIGRKQK